VFFCFVFLSLLSGSESGSILKRGGSFASVPGADVQGDAAAAASQVQGDHQESAVTRLSNLAVKLGETFMASDLTALLQLKKLTALSRAADSKALQVRIPCLSRVCFFTSVFFCRREWSWRSKNR
jgi:hypothetical protein